MLVIFVLQLVSGCINNNYCDLPWNRDFVSGKINETSIKMDVPIHSKLKVLMNYVSKHNIPNLDVVQDEENRFDDRCFGYIYYSNKISGEDIAFFMDPDSIPRSEVKYCIELHGHQILEAFPSYFHPVLYFYYNNDDELIGIANHGYP